MAMKLEDLLQSLASVLDGTDPDEKAVVSSLVNLVTYLCQPGGGTHQDCVTVNDFVLLEILCNPSRASALKQLPADVIGIIEDLGMCLHDTHTAPNVAAEFDSMPAQLRVRVAALQRRGFTS